MWVPVAVSISACVVFVGPDAVCHGGFSGVQVCIDRSEYAPGSVIRLTMSNRSEETIFLDGCALQLIERAQLRMSGATYDPVRRCGPDFTLADVLAHMDEIRPGETLTRTISVPTGISQGFYRVLQWRLDVEGGLLSDEPLRTAEFDILPSAG